MATSKFIRYNTQAEVETALQKYPKIEIHKIIMLGNAGAGKSFLLSAMAENQIFEHKGQVNSVTRDVEYGVSIDETTGIATVLYNIPGLIEAEEEKIELNIACIERAFRESPQAKTKLICVFGYHHGRLLDQDIETFEAVATFVPQLRSTATGIVINSVAYEDIDDSEQYKQETIEEVKKRCQFPSAQIRFIEDYPRDRLKVNNYASPEMKEIHNTLEDLCNALQADQITPEPGKKLKLKTTELRDKQKEISKELESLQKKITPSPTNSLPNSPITKLDQKQIAEAYSQLALLFDQLVVIKNSLNKKAEKNARYIKVAKSVTQLCTTLQQEKSTILKYQTPSPAVSSSYEKCFAAIKIALDESNNHRGWYAINPIIRGILGVFAIITIVPALIIEASSKHGYKNTFFGQCTTATSEELNTLQSKLVDQENKFAK